MPHFSEIWVRTYCYVLIQDSVAYSHCSYLDIYISQKTRLCLVDLEGQFQTILKAKLIKPENSNLLLSFIFYFCRNCQILNPVLFGECQWYFKKVLCRKINRLDITIQPFSHKSLILIFIFFKDSVISLWKISQLDTKLTFFLYM